MHQRSNTMESMSHLPISYLQNTNREEYQQPSLASHNRHNEYNEEEDIAQGATYNQHKRFPK